MYIQLISLRVLLFRDVLTILKIAHWLACWYKIWKFGCKQQNTSIRFCFNSCRLEGIE